MRSADIVTEGEREKSLEEGKPCIKQVEGLEQSPTGCAAPGKGEVGQSGEQERRCKTSGKTHKEGEIQYDSVGWLELMELPGRPIGLENEPGHPPEKQDVTEVGHILGSSSFDCSSEGDDRKNRSP
jgi:hypothetical protein